MRPPREAIARTVVAVDGDGGVDVNSLLIASVAHTATQIGIRSPLQVGSAEAVIGGSISVATDLPKEYLGIVISAYVETKLSARPCSRTGSYIFRDSREGSSPMRIVFEA